MSVIKDFAEHFEYWCRHDSKRPDVRLFLYAIEEIEEAAAKGIIPDGMTADEVLYLTGENTAEGVLAMNRLISLMARGKQVHPLVRELFVPLPGRESRLEWRHTRRGKPPWGGKQFDIKRFVWDAIMEGRSESEANALAAKKYKVSKRYVQKVIADQRKRAARLAERERT